MASQVYRVVLPRIAYKHIGTVTTSNTYVGSSMALPAVYEEVVLAPGDFIFDLPGGTFWQPRGAGPALSVRPDRPEKHPFEKTYGGYGFEAKWGTAWLEPVSSSKAVQLKTARKDRHFSEPPKGSITWFDSVIPLPPGAVAVLADQYEAAGDLKVAEELRKSAGALAGSPAEHANDFQLARHDALEAINDAVEAMKNDQCLVVGKRIDDAYVAVGRMQANAYEGADLAEAARVMKALKRADEPFEEKCVRSEPAAATAQRMTWARPGLAGVRTSLMSKLRTPR